MQIDGDQNQPDIDGSSPTDPRLADTVEISPLTLGEAAKKVSIPEVLTSNFIGGQAAWLTMQSPQKQTGNEDSLDFIEIEPSRGLLVVADGLGGHRGGGAASKLLVTWIKNAFRNGRSRIADDHILISGGLKVPLNALSRPESDNQSRSIVLDRIEQVNRRLLRRKTGSATTIALVEVSANRARTYHVGDSLALVISQRGRIKYGTVSHSPVGYAFEAGVYTEEEAIMHQHRHFVSNVVGSRDMSIEIGQWIDLAARDTILLASDGLFDNLFTHEIIDCIRKGKLESGVQSLAEIAVERMTSPIPDVPSKPDDLTILAYRRL